MPQFDDEVLVRAPLEEVWKLVHDPSRYPEWWTGIGSVEPAPDGYTMYPEGWPDYPMPQRLQTSSADGRVTISCLVSDLEYRWHLTADGERTRVQVHVDIPEVEAHRLETQASAMSSALARLPGWPPRRQPADERLSISAPLDRHPGVRLDRARPDRRSNGMTEYAILLTGDEDRWANATAEERAATFARHDRFTVALGERGHTVTGGAELEHSRGAKVVRGTSGAVSVTDGPYAEAAEQLGGFYLVSSDNLDDLLDVCGILADGDGAIEVRVCVPAPADEA